MSSATLKKIIPCKKNQLIEMVLDIEKYPEFVPWCIEGKIFDKNESSDLITFNGDLKVGKSILNETFSSHVSYHKETDKIIVTNLDGPLRHLKNEWHFKEINNNTQLEFFIDFELKNPILNGIMKRSFELGLSKISKSKVCVSITGIAGPKGGSKQKPVGLVYIGIRVGKKVIVNKCNFKNKGRAYIQRQTVKKSLNMLFRLIKQGN